MYNHNRDKSHFEEKVLEIENLAQRIATKHLLYGTAGMFFETQQLVAHLRRGDRVALLDLVRRDSIT
jgi:hypothetical protein